MISPCWATMYRQPRTFWVTSPLRCPDAVCFCHDILHWFNAMEGRRPIAPSTGREEELTLKLGVAWIHVRFHQDMCGNKPGESEPSSTTKMAAGCEIRTSYHFGDRRLIHPTTAALYFWSTRCFFKGIRWLRLHPSFDQLDVVNCSK